MVYHMVHQMTCGERQSKVGDTLLRKLSVKQIGVFIVRFGSTQDRVHYFGSQNRKDLCRIFKRIPNTRQYWELKRDGMPRYTDADMAALIRKIYV
jgi:hypothetical protein